MGGIAANDTYPAEFLYENVMIEANIIHTAQKTGVEKLLFLGSSCIYPKFAPRISARRRCRRCAGAPDAMLSGAGACQCRGRQGSDHPETGLPAPAINSWPLKQFECGEAVSSIPAKAVSTFEVSAKELNVGPSAVDEHEKVS